MQTVKLGTSGPEITRIGLGALSFGGFYGPTTVEDSHACLDACRDRGINFVDTAEVYGMGVSEDIIGQYIAKNPDHGFVIATKGGIKSQPTRHFANTREALEPSLDASLKRLRIDCVDLFYIHRRQADMPIEDVMGVLEGFQKAGKIKHIGFSEIAPASLRRAAAVAPVAAVQSEYSLWTRLPELGMIQACGELGTTFVSFSPMARNMLGDRFADPATFPDSDFRKNNPRFMEPNFSANLPYLTRFKDYAASKGVSSAALALAWVLAKALHIVTIPGTRYAKHLNQNADGDQITLTTAEIQEIETILPLGFAHGARYSDAQFIGIEQYC